MYNIIASNAERCLPLEITFLAGSLSTWIQTSLGFGDNALLPSVRSGLEFAILNLVAATRGVPLSALLLGKRSTLELLPDDDTRETGLSTPVYINGLVSGATIIQPIYYAHQR